MVSWKPFGESVAAPSALTRWWIWLNSWIQWCPVWWSCCVSLSVAELCSQWHPLLGNRSFCDSVPSMLLLGAMVLCLAFWLLHTQSMIASHLRRHALYDRRWRESIVRRATGATSFERMRAMSGEKKKGAIVWAWPSIQLAFAETLYKNCEHSEHMNKFFVVAVLRTIISQKLFSRRLLHTRSTCQKREKSETCPSVVQYLFLIASNISQAHSLLPRSGWSL